ncbi:Oxygen-independent coproporphyrinogen-III oxidase 1 [Cognatishimia activa]|uniref:Heme chaperone HemW n=1 Tax=Cognatishimia activa TaxID=1715691 RepID=A0A0P1ILT2_9RHOB|nr:Oxygen-independent coproporphyrinogen-III oxidase 1 [Cognatishimia activa]CUK24582.1 Oxygen-independent coproporphyrinogen-III oxidase 1 [Cognatishimia activa]
MLLAVLGEDWKNGGFGLYIHWPFCQAKCPYCDFNSHVSQKIDQKQWLSAYLSELDRVGSETQGRVLNSVFFGGGTPSLMDPEIVAAILERVHRLWPTANDLEVTLEANPGSVEAAKFADYRLGGVSRISMGVQALNDRDLKRLGRIHSVDEAKAAFDIARKTFDRVSFDLIYARQDQTLEAWKAELREALSMAFDHLSLYQLTIEAGTPFGQRYEKGKLKGLPEDDLAADMYQVTGEICAEVGLEGYEVSNYALPGSESRHNQIYWRYGDYVGIGPGAHGRVTLGGQRFATECIRNPTLWLDAVSKQTAENVRRAISLPDQADEMMMMGLRLSEGVDIARWQNLSGRPLNSNVTDHLEDIGMIRQAQGRIYATQDGRMVLNTLLAEILVD